MGSAKKMPCYGKEYDGESYACKRACKFGGEPEESRCAAITRGLEALDTDELEVRSEKLESQPQPMEVEVMEERTEPTAVEQPAEPAVEPTAVEQPAEPAVEPTAVEQPAEPAPAPQGAKSKKDVIRTALKTAPPDGVAADTIVQMIVDSGLISGADQDAVAKTRHYVIMSISHMRKAGQQIELKEGKYVLAGEQSSAS